MANVSEYFPDTEAEYFFPPAPIEGTSCLIPITSWAEMYAEILITGVVFDEFWYESIQDEVAYFFKWIGEPRATILVVWEDDHPTHIECRTIGDEEIPACYTTEIVSDVVAQFCRAGYWLHETRH